MGRNAITEEEYARAKSLVLERLSAGGPGATIRNRALRALTDLNYDQAIRFFGRMVQDGHLIRVGRGTNTHYVLPDVLRP